jgi:D-3-phosphoglycerate dehydrogenase
MLADAGVEVVPNSHGRRLTEDEIIAHLDGVDGLIAGLEPLTERVLRSAPRLRVIARVGIGVDNVDLDAAASLGIAVSNTPEGPTDAVAELTVAAALAVTRSLVQANNALHEGQWEKSITDGVRGATALVVGYGRIGKRVTELLSALGARVQAADPMLPPGEFEGAERVVLEDGLANADIVTLHASGRECLLTGEQLATMKPGAVLLNGARAELVDEDALCTALDSGLLKAVWFDVYWEEPYRGRLTRYPQALLTPHVGTYTRTCRLNMEMTAVKNLLRDLGRAGVHPAQGR